MCTILYNTATEQNSNESIGTAPFSSRVSAEMYLGSRIGHTVGHIAYETTHVAVLDELRHALSDVVEEAHGVSQEVHRAQDLGCLADQLLQTGNTTQ